MIKKGVDPEGLSFSLPRMKCKQCDHTWFARKVGEINNCPKCRSTDWNGGKPAIVKHIPILICPKCSYSWVPRNNALRECPECKKKLFRKTGVRDGGNNKRS